MKKRNKIALLTLGIAGVAILASGCTANFCTNKDKTKIAYAIESGVSTYQESLDGVDDNDFSVAINSNLYQIVKINSEGKYENSSLLNDIISSASQNGIVVPSKEYFVALDYKVLSSCISSYNEEHTDSTYSLETLTAEQAKSILKDYGYLKFANGESSNLFANYKSTNDTLRNEIDYSVAASIDFEEFYVSNMNSKIDTYRSCITTFDKVEYGNYNGDTVALEKVTWKYAWKQGGHLIEGLVVYPVAWMVDGFARAIAGGRNASPDVIQSAYQSGTPQILSLIIVTIIVRLFIFLVTIKSTLSQKKMTNLQPELAKIQQKYPNANSNQSEKQRLAEEQMRLYKKHKVNPLSQLLVLIVQFPVFIGVWGAMTGSAVLSTGSVLNLHLSDSIWTTLKAGPKVNGGVNGWWTAFVLIILMSVAQFFAMKVPQWIQKTKTKKVARLGKNPAQKSQNRTANIVSYVMLVMIIIMGFTLPAAMGVYWLIGALFSLIQTVFTSYVFVGKKRK